MTDALLLHTAAGQFVESFGEKAPPVLYGRAELAEECGHRVAARTWRDLADVAERLLRQQLAA